MLASFFYLKAWDKWRTRICMRDWALDSGGFSAYNSGAKIDLQEYIETCRELLATDPKLTEVFALDVIGDHKATQKNVDKMWAAGVPAIPCFHVGEPWSYLLHIAKNYPKIALGGVALKHEAKKLVWAGQCFARAWPKKIHGFAFTGRKSLLAFPWDSVDSTSWCFNPLVYGGFRSYGVTRFPVKRKSIDLKPEIEWFLNQEKLASHRWRRQLEEIGSERLTLRLATTGGMELEHLTCE
jgi:hypothetical protein